MFSMGSLFVDVMDSNWNPEKGMIEKIQKNIPKIVKIKGVEVTNKSASTITPVVNSKSQELTIKSGLISAKRADIDDINAKANFTVKAGYDDQGKPNFLDANGDLVAGIYTDIPNEVYHSLPAFSSSMIKKFLTSPAHYYRHYIDPVNRKRTSKAMEYTLDAGTYAHELILEPNGFYDRYFRELSQAENPNLLSSSEDIKSLCKENGLKLSGTKAVLIERLIEHDPCLGEFIFDVMQQRHLEANQGKTPIDAVVWDDAHRACKTVRNNEWADTLLSDGISELSVIALCPETGRWLKVRFDWLSYDGVPVDLKTSRSANPLKVIYYFADLKYDIQAYMYSYVGRLAGIPIPRYTFPFVCVEFIDADICEVFELSHDDFRIAGKNYHHAINELVECLETNDWYGYTDEIGSTRITLSKRGRV
ncbi:PD-(D/E)XK nuclease-like domain-containing protein [Photobacterium toruni]|uniref:PD-(D/E)XK nuclease-like domain-containing protein n=1 Tax=Photobacterium toruni TaxID=1935446 RepID=UPI00210F4190|nr:PD-(D/E)XK nuclease-like domain-containing protein [Photobacterium toruni]